MTANRPLPTGSGRPSFDPEIVPFPHTPGLVAPTDPRRWPPEDAVQARLSRREREILPLLAARWTDREIAEALCISYRTVTTHVAHIFDKLGVNSRRAVAAVAWTAPFPSDPSAPAA